MKKTFKLGEPDNIRNDRFHLQLCSIVEYVNVPPFSFGFKFNLFPRNIFQASL